jgi:hypothetical protein
MTPLLGFTTQKPAPIWRMSLESHDRTIHRAGPMLTGGLKRDVGAARFAVHK